MKRKIKSEAFFIVLSLFLFIFAWSAFDYYQATKQNVAIAATGARTASLSVTVAETITLTQLTGGTVAFGTLTPGTKVTGTTQLQVLTNGTGMNITAGRLRSNTTPAALASGASPYNTTYHIDDDADLRVFTGLGSCTNITNTWVNGSSTGLGYTNYAFNGGSAKSSCWGTGTSATDANNKYAALQASASASSFISSSGYSSSATRASIGYALDVTTTQPATDYSGGVVFSATTNP